MDLVQAYYEQITGDNGTLFRPARLKIKRAKRHILEVEIAARILPRRGHLNFVVGVDANAGQVNLTYITNPMPLEFATAVGDAVHNIRAAFDYIAKALTVPPVGTGAAKDTYFPTGVDRDAFIRSRDGVPPRNGKPGKVGKMQGAPQEALLLIEELQPYKGGKHSLKALHDLDTWDKHKLLIPTIAEVHIHELEFSVRGEDRSLSSADFKSVSNGTNFVAIVDCPRGAGHEDFKFKDNFKATFDIVFGKGQPLEGESIVPTLTNLADVATTLIEQCEALYPGYVRV